MKSVQVFRAFSRFNVCTSVSPPPTARLGIICRETLGSVDALAAAAMKLNPGDSEFYDTVAS
jgi:hypothetical protein